MNDALRSYRPTSNWLTAALLTLLVICFGIFAEVRASQLQSTDVIATQTAIQETSHERI